jgi:hypothetical protein
MQVEEVFQKTIRDADVELITAYVNDLLFDQR